MAWPARVAPATRAGLRHGPVGDTLSTHWEYGAYMRPRSIVFTLYGDYLRYCGDGGAPLGALSDLLAMFGVERPTTRVVMSRLRAEGWFETRREGRSTTYLLSPQGWKLLNEGRERIFRHDPGNWQGEWTLILTRTGDRNARDEFRRTLTWLGFGQLQPATWLAPGDRRSLAETALQDRPDVAGEVFLTRTEDLERDRDLAQRCWDLGELDSDYRRFLENHARPLDVLTGEEALVRRVRLTDDYRRFPFTDPDLPASLLPADWHGGQAHALFVAQHEALAAAAESTVERIVGLPIHGVPRLRMDGGRVSFDVAS